MTDAYRVNYFGVRLASKGTLALVCGRSIRRAAMVVSVLR